MSRIWQQGFELDGATYSQRVAGTEYYDNLAIVSSAETTGASYAPQRGIADETRGGLGIKSYKISCPAISNWWGHVELSSDLKTDSNEIFGRFWLRHNIPKSFYFYRIFDSSDKQLFSVYISQIDTESYALKFCNKTNEVYDYRVLKFGEWVKIDYRFILDANGKIQVKINDRLVTTWEGNTVATADAKIAKVSFGTSTLKTNSESFIGKTISFDDMAINDNTGIVNNSWCGNGSIVAIHPYANGSVNQFTPMEGTQNFENVDELIPDGDTTYNSSYAIGDTDLFKFKIDGIDEGQVINSLGIATQAKFLEQPLNMAHIITVNGEEQEVLDFKLSNGYAYQSSYAEVNPKTNAKYTIEELNNSLEIGYRTKDYVE